jgi:hypothetical protein
MANIPEMLRDILASELVGDPAIEVLISPEDSELLASIIRLRPDVVIAGCGDAPPSWGDELPQLYLLAADASWMRLVELRSVSHDMTDVSLRELVDSIKAGKARPHAGRHAP